jgi:hypothetical protein
MGNVLSSAGSGIGQGLGTVLGGLVGGIWTFVTSIISGITGFPQEQVSLWLKVFIVLFICFMIYRMFF